MIISSDSWSLQPKRSLPYSLTRRVRAYYLWAAAMVVCALWFNLRVHYTVRPSTAGSPIPEWHEHDFSESPVMHLATSF